MSILLVCIFKTRFIFLGLNSCPSAEEAAKVDKLGQQFYRYIKWVYTFAKVRTLAILTMNHKNILPLTRL